MSCDPEEILSFDQFQALWKKFIKYGVFICSLVFKILLVDSSKAADTQTTKSANEFYKMFEVEGMDDKIRDRIVEVFSFIVENDFI